MINAKENWDTLKTKNKNGNQKVVRISYVKFTLTKFSFKKSQKYF